VERIERQRHRQLASALAAESPAGGWSGLQPSTQG
jgi:hypothetical protein